MPDYASHRLREYIYMHTHTQHTHTGNRRRA
jgi:hypothetical protein